MRSPQKFIILSLSATLIAGPGWAQTASVDATDVPDNTVTQPTLPDDSDLFEAPSTEKPSLGDAMAALDDETKVADQKLADADQKLADANRTLAKE